MKRCDGTDTPPCATIWSAHDNISREELGREGLQVQQNAHISSWNDQLFKKKIKKIVIWSPEKIYLAIIERTVKQNKSIWPSTMRQQLFPSSLLTFIIFLPLQHFDIHYLFFFLSFINWIIFKSCPVLPSQSYECMIRVNGLGSHCSVSHYLLLSELNYVLIHQDVDVA